MLSYKANTRSIDRKEQGRLQQVAHDLEARRLHALNEGNRHRADVIGEAIRCVHQAVIMAVWP